MGRRAVRHWIRWRVRWSGDSVLSSLSTTHLIRSRRILIRIATGIHWPIMRSQTSPGECVRSSWENTCSVLAPTRTRMTIYYQEIPHYCTYTMVSLYLPVQSNLGLQDKTLSPNHVVYPAANVNSGPIMLSCEAGDRPTGDSTAEYNIFYFFRSFGIAFCTKNKFAGDLISCAHKVIFCANGGFIC